MNYYSFLVEFNGAFFDSVLLFELELGEFTFFESFLLLFASDVAFLFD